MALIGATAPPYRPAYLEVPTDLLTAEVGEPGPAPTATDGGARTPAGTATARAVGPAPTEAEGGIRGEPQEGTLGRADDGERVGAAWNLDRAVALLEAAERPLIWAGGGAVDAGPEIAALAERLAAPVLTTYGARGSCPRIIRAWSTCRRTSSRPAACGTRPTSSSRSARTSTACRPRTGRSRSRRACWPSTSTSRTRPRTTASTRSCPSTSAHACAALAERAPSRDGLDALATATRAMSAPRRAPAWTPTPCGSSTRCPSRCPRTPSLVVDMCIPGYWVGGLPHRRRAAAAPGPARLGHARLRLPRRARRRARGDRPDRLALRRRRLPVRAGRARHDGAGAHPADRGHRRRRRLRDAPLRPDAVGRPDLRRRPSHARLRRAGAELRHSGRGRRGPRRRVRRGARAPRRGPRAERARRARARARGRRRTRRRTGTAAGLAERVARSRRPYSGSRNSASASISITSIWAFCSLPA